MPRSPSHLSLGVQDFEKSGLVIDSDPPAKCLDLMRAGNPDKCSIIRGNRKTRWISGEDLLCVNTRIYQIQQRGFFCFPFSSETFSWRAQLSSACWDDEVFYSGRTLSNVPLCRPREDFIRFSSFDYFLLPFDFVH